MKNILIIIPIFCLFLGCSTNNNNVTVVPAAPTSLTAIVINSGQVNLQWSDNATNESGYKIQRKTSAGNYADIGSTGADITIFSDQGLTPNTSYTYRVYAFNQAGNSLQYSNEVTVTTNSSTSNLCEVTIGTQVWSCKNLDVTTYRNGDPIPQVTDPTQWANLTTGAWCYYNNDPANGPTYGKLYNWYAVNDPRGLAPSGWHVPSDSEWKILSKYLDPNADTSCTTCLESATGGGYLKETGTNHWMSPNTGATNSTGFSALPGGYRQSGAFIEFSYSGSWWCSGYYNLSNAHCRTLDNSSSIIDRAYPPKNGGASVRLIKN